MLLLAACARTGTGQKDHTLILNAIDAPGTKVIVKNFKGRTGKWLLHATLNGRKIGELGAGEFVIADARVGRNTIKLQFFGHLISGDDGAKESFTMAPNQKRFFIGDRQILRSTPGYVLYRPLAYELRQSEFLGRSRKDLPETR